MWDMTSITSITSPTLTLSHLDVHYTLAPVNNSHSGSPLILCTVVFKASPLFTIHVFPWLTICTVASGSFYLWLLSSFCVTGLLLHKHLYEVVKVPILLSTDTAGNSLLSGSISNTTVKDVSSSLMYKALKGPVLDVTLKFHLIKPTWDSELIEPLEMFWGLRSWLQENPVSLSQQPHAAISVIFFYSICLKDQDTTCSTCGH